MVLEEGVEFEVELVDVDGFVDAEVVADVDQAGPFQSCCGMGMVKEGSRKRALLSAFWSV